MTCRHRRAFTLIEILVVIGIIAVLVTLVTFGAKSVIGGQREKATRTTMESLKNLIAESQATGGRGPQQLDAVYAAFYPANTPPPYQVAAPLRVARDFGDSYTDKTDRFPIWESGAPKNATAATQAVIGLLRSVPNNAKWIAALPSEQQWLPKPPPATPAEASPGAPAIPLFLDAWGNPIIYVPSGGLAGVVASGGTGTEDVRVINVTSRDQRGFWASAGPDGFFTDPDPSLALKERKPFGDDNVYSFE